MKSKHSSSWSSGMAATINGRTMTIADWAREYGVSLSTVRSRMCYGRMSAEDAITTPIQRLGSQRALVDNDRAKEAD